MPAIVSAGYFSDNPAHQPGDVLVAFAFGTTTSKPSIPTPSELIPSWQDAFSTTASVNGSAVVFWRVCWVLASRSNHQIGSWGNTTTGWVVVIRGADPNNPIGGSGIRNVAASKHIAAPAITQANTDGSSVLLYAHGFCDTRYAATWSAAPAGYTAYPATDGKNGRRVLFKTDTTSNTGVTGTISLILAAVSGVSLEIVGPRPAQRTVRLLQRGVWSDAMPKGVLQNGNWQQAQRVSVLQGGQWRPLWRPAAAAADAANSNPAT